MYRTACFSRKYFDCPSSLPAPLKLARRRRVETGGIEEVMVAPPTFIRDLA